MKPIYLLRPLSLIAALAVPAFATANTQNFSFTECLSGCSGNVESVASLAITSITNGLSFELTNSVSPTGFISDFYANGGFGFADNFVGQTTTTYTYSPTFNVRVATSINGYNYDFSYPTSNSQDRFWPGDTATWTITGENVTFDSFVNPLKMMVHVQGLEGGVSQKIGAIAAVPEPESYALLLAGLGIMGAVARRRRPFD